MTKKLKKIVVLFMSVVLMICCMPVMTTQAVEQKNITDQLNSMINQYANRTATSSQMYMGSQCKGFANWVFKQIFGVYIGPYPASANYKLSNANAQLVGMINPGGLTAETSSELLKQAKPGDYIQVQRSVAKSGGRCGPHSMIVVSVQSDGVQVLDCNSDGRNTIKTYLYTWSQFDYDNRGMSLYHAYGYQESSDAICVIDNVSPVISSVQVKDITADGYTVSCTVTDDVAVDRVQFPTWTEKSGQDDIQKNWDTSTKAKGTKVGSTYSYRVSKVDHNNEGGIYTTHIYAFDTSGNLSTYVVQSVIIDIVGPVISNVQVKDITADGYTVSCTVTDDVAVDRVQFPTWTEKNGQDDIQKNWDTSTKAKGTKVGSTYSYRVSKVAHNNEGGIYFTHIYAFDTSGNLTACVIPNEFIELKSIYYGDIDMNGRITVSDLSAVKKAVVGQISLTSEQKKRADVNGDGKINSVDVSLISRYIIGRISTFPIEK